MALRLRNVVSVTGPEPGHDREALSHADLVDRLTGSDRPATARTDLALLAYALPDKNASKTVATYLNKVTGGEAHSLALTGDGLGTPFMAVGVADACQRAGQSRSPLVAIVECAVDAETAGAAYAEIDSGVLLDFDTDVGDGVVRLVDSSGWPDDLAAKLAGAITPAEPLLVILGPGTEAAVVPDGDVDVHGVPPTGSYCTSVWLALAENWAKWAERYSAIALCATDPGSGTSHLAVLRTQGSGGERG